MFVWNIGFHDDLEVHLVALALVCIYLFDDRYLAVRDRLLAHVWEISLESMLWFYFVGWFFCLLYTLEPLVRASQGWSFSRTSRGWCFFWTSPAAQTPGSRRFSWSCMLPFLIFTISIHFLCFTSSSSVHFFFCGWLHPFSFSTVARTFWTRTRLWTFSKRWRICTPLNRTQKTSRKHLSRLLN